MNEFVDLVLSVAPGTTIVIGMSLLSESLFGGVKLEGPQEVVGFFEVGSDGVDFINEILKTGNAVLAELSLNDGVISKRDSAFVDLAISSLVDQVSDSLLAGVSVGNVGFNSSDHVDSGLVESHESSVVELSQSEELEDFLAGGVKLVDTIKNCDIRSIFCFANNILNSLNSDSI